VHGAKLLIAKLDRLARNVAFIANLVEAGVEFEAVDLPQANKLTLHVTAAMQSTKPLQYLLEQRQHWRLQKLQARD